MRQRILSDRGSYRGASGGFTIVELVVVIVIIGILAAVALPKFVDLTGNAHTAAVQGTGGALAAAANIVHAGWMAGGGSSDIDVVTLEGGTDVGVTDTGWPENDDAVTANNTILDTECVMIWNLILTNPPSVSVTADAADFLATVASPVCTFTHEATTGRSITYNANTGAVVITVP